MLRAKKSLVMLLSAVMVMSMFAGCTKPASETKKADEVSVEDNAPKPELKALVGYKSGMDYNNYPVQKFLEEKTGYKVQYDTLPQDNPMDKLNLIIASAQEYDFITIQDRTRYASYAQQGALTDVEDLIKQFGPNITKNLDPATIDAVRVNEKLFCIPAPAVSGRDGTTNISGGILVRQDWLTKLNIKTPTTIVEFTSMLQQFKDKDPNGNGAKNIPLTVDQGLALWDYGVGGAFGIATQWTDVSGKLVPRVQMDGFKDYISYLKDLYTKGLIDKEAPTNQGTTAKEKFTSGRAGAFIDGWYDIPTLGDTFLKTQPTAKMAYLPPLAGDGSNKAAQVGNDLKTAIDVVTMIPKSSKHATDVVKYINLKLEEDTFKEMVIGQENVTYTVKDGGYYPILPIFFEQRGNANQYLTGCTKLYGEYWLARLRKDDRLYQAWKEVNVDYASSIIVEPISKAPTLPIKAKSQAVLDKLTSDFILKSVVDDFSDATLSEFLTQWKTQGGDDTIKEVNEWYSKSEK